MPEIRLSSFFERSYITTLEPILEYPLSDAQGWQINFTVARRDTNLHAALDLESIRPVLDS